MTEDRYDVAHDVTEPKLTYKTVSIPRGCTWCGEPPTHAVVMASHVVPEASVVPDAMFVCDAHAHPHYVAEQLTDWYDLDAWQDESSRELVEGHEGDDS